MDDEQLSDAYETIVELREYIQYLRLNLCQDCYDKLKTLSEWKDHKHTGGLRKTTYISVG